MKKGKRWREKFIKITSLKIQDRKFIKRFKK